MTWSHYLEILRADDPLEIAFYAKECENSKWSVRELHRQMQSMLFHRIALSRDKEGVLALANQGDHVRKPEDILRDPYVLEFAGLPVAERLKENRLHSALIGIVLGANKDDLVVQFATQGISNHLFVSKYQLYLPNEDQLRGKLAALLDNVGKDKRESHNQ